MKLASAGKSWFVARCAPQREVKAAEELRQAGFETYLPRWRQDVMSHRTKTYRTITKLLMPPYLFVAMPEGGHHFGFARACGGVEGFLGVEGAPAEVSGAEVERLQIMEMDMAFDDTRAARIHRKEEAVNRKEAIKDKFPIGARVEVMEGTFANIMGFVSKHEKTGRIKVDVNAFGASFTVDADPEKLKSAA